ncbi:MAG: copper chaperone CopZ [Clostridia bacterium]|nr:copper chaperone CopZ [Clostridia bacterium]
MNRVQQSVVIKVEGMSCNHCKMAVEGALKRLTGVTNATVDLQGGQVRVEYDPAQVGIEQMKASIKEAGYEPA